VALLTLAALAGFTACGALAQEDSPAKPEPSQEEPASASTEDPEVEAFRDLGGKFVAKGFKSSWAPDGTRLVFGRQEATFAEQGGGLSVLDLKTGKITDLVTEGKDPAWSPKKGRYIAYVAGGYGAEEHIWIVDPSGENARKIAEGGYPSWSQDGKTLYYHSRTQRKIMTIDIDAATPEPREIMSSTYWYPAVSADGKRVAFRSGNQIVVAVCQTGETVKEYTVPPARGFLGNWSPDGKYLAFGGYGFHDVPGLWILEVETGDLKRLSKGFFTQPAWSADGSKLSVDLRLRSGFEIWVIDAKVVDSLEPYEMPRDRYAVPEGDVEELAEFIREIRNFRPRSALEYREHRAKSVSALRSAAEKILEVEKDQASEAYQLAKTILLESRVRRIGGASLEEKKEILRDLESALAEKAKTELESRDLGLAMTVARALEYGGQTELAAEAYETFASVIGTASDENLTRYVEMFEGCARRLRLPGNVLGLKGTKLDGGELDWDGYRGKVVLVDFWATWCGPCLAELPNVREYYELYHDRGFDVVGISLDRTRKALEDFLEKEPLPWVTLYDEEAGGSHPMATYYGVMAIPTVLLVDKEGKVLSLRARGEELGRLLKEQLGPVDEEKLREMEQQTQKEANAETKANDSEKRRSSE
jgi:thiol-disulfide isomerase/thioredoxin